MRALRFERFGPPDQLQLQEIAVPDLKPDEVLVEIQAAAINPSDVNECLWEHGTYHSASDSRT